MTLPTAQTQPFATESRWKIVLAGAVIVLAALTAYHNSFKGPFIFDDPPSTAENPTIRPPWSIPAMLSPPTHTTVGGRPLANLSFAISYALSGTDVWGYHTVNLAIHLLAGLTLFGVVRRTLRLVGRVVPNPPLSDADPSDRRNKDNAPYPATLLAVVVALLWTVHPLQTEAVTYVVQRTESLMGLCYLLTVYCFIRGAECQETNAHVGTTKTQRRQGGGSRYRDFFVSLCLRGSRSGGAWWFALASAACLLGMASKEVMVSAPVMVLLYDRTFLAGTLREAWRRRWRVYLALAATWILLGYLVASVGGNRAGSTGIGSGATMGAYALTQFQAVADYLRLSLWPHPLILDYGAEWVGKAIAVVPPGLLVILLAAGTLFGLRRRPAIGFLGAWFFAILAPTSLVPGARQTMAEHRMYLALAAVICVLVIGAYVWGGRRTLVAWMALAVGLGWLTASRNRDYRSDLSIWSDTVANRPRNRWAHDFLGLALYNRGRLEEALLHIGLALKLGPDDPRPHNDLGVVLARLGRRPEALNQYETALRLRPTFPEAHNNLANELMTLPGRGPEALAHFEQALQYDPGFVEAHINLANALAKLPGRLPEAFFHYEQALRLDPDNLAAHRSLARTHYNLAVILETMPGREPEAFAHYREALRLDPAYAEAHNNLAVLLARRGQREQAREHWETALRLKPGYEDARKNLQLLQTLERP